MFAPKNCQARACHFCSCSKVECCRASACCDELSFRASREVKASRMPRASREHIDRSVFVCVLFDVAWRLYIHPLPHTAQQRPACSIRPLDPRRPPSAPAAREAFELAGASFDLRVVKNNLCSDTYCLTSSLESPCECSLCFASLLNFAPISRDSPCLVPPHVIAMAVYHVDVYGPFP